MASVDPLATGTHPTSLVAHLLGAPRREVARRQVPVARVEPLEIVIALVLGNLVRRSRVPFLFGHPDAAVVAERLAHQRELGLVLAGLRDAGRVDLGEAGVREQGATPMRAPNRGDIAPLRVRREIIDVRVPTGREDHRVPGVGAHRAVDQVPHDDPACLAVDDDQVEHLRTGVHPHVAGADLARQGLIGAQQELLPGLAPGVERAGHLDAAERAVGEHAAVLAREWDALRGTLVDDARAHLRQAVHVGLARAKVPALDGVVE